MVVALILKKFLYFRKKKHFLYFLKSKLFLYFQKWNPALFSPSWKNKKFHHEKVSYTLGNGGPEKVSYSFSKKVFLIFREKGTPKNSLYFRKRKPKETSYI